MRLASCQSSTPSNASSRNLHAHRHDVRVGGTIGSRGHLPGYPSSIGSAGPVSHAYVSAGLDRAARRRRAHQAIRFGPPAPARAAWLPSHLTYERLCAAYGHVRPTSTADRRPCPDWLDAGCPIRPSPGSTGIEYGLWHGQGGPQLGRRAQPAGPRTSCPCARPGRPWSRPCSPGSATHEIL